MGSRLVSTLLGHALGVAAVVGAGLVCALLWPDIKAIAVAGVLLVVLSMGGFVFAMVLQTYAVARGAGHVLSGYFLVVALSAMLLLSLDGLHDPTAHGQALPEWEIPALVASVALLVGMVIWHRSRAGHLLRQGVLVVGRMLMSLVFVASVPVLAPLAIPAEVVALGFAIMLMVSVAWVLWAAIERGDGYLIAIALGMLGAGFVLHLSLLSLAWIDGPQAWVPVIGVAVGVALVSEWLRRRLMRTLRRHHGDGRPSEADEKT